MRTQIAREMRKRTKQKLKKPKQTLFISSITFQIIRYEYFEYFSPAQSIDMRVPKYRTQLSLGQHKAVSCETQKKQSQSVCVKTQTKTVANAT